LFTGPEKNGSKTWTGELLNTLLVIIIIIIIIISTIIIIIKFLSSRT